MQFHVIDLNILVFLNRLHRVPKRGFSTQQNFIMSLLCELNTGLIVEINYMGPQLVPIYCSYSYSETLVY